MESACTSGCFTHVGSSTVSGQITFQQTLSGGRQMGPTWPKMHSWHHYEYGYFKKDKDVWVRTFMKEPFDNSIITRRKSIRYFSNNCPRELDHLPIICQYVLPNNFLIKMLKIIFSFLKAIWDVCHDSFMHLNEIHKETVLN